VEKLNNNTNRKFQKIYDLLLVIATRGYNSLKTALAKSKKNAPKTPETDTGEYGYSTLFELCVYLLSRLDTSLFKYSQDRSVRHELVSSIIHRLKEDLGKHLEQKNLIEIINQRMTEYGRCFHERERDKAKAAEEQHAVLVNNIRYAKNNNESKFWESGITSSIPSSLITDSLILLVFEKRDVLLFQDALKHLFHNVEDFTTLSLDEIDKRIASGIEEAKRTTKNLDEELFL